MFSVECEKCKNAIPLGMMDCPVCKAKEAAGDTQTGMAPVGAPMLPQSAGPMPPPGANVSAPGAPMAAPPNYQQAPPFYQQPPPGYPQAQPPYQQSPPGYQQAPPPYQQAPPAYQQTYMVPQPKAALPSWLVAAGVAVLMGIVLAVGYLVLLPRLRNGARTTADTPGPAFESPAQTTPAAKPPAAGAKFGKYIEVVGIRIVEENKKAVVKFLVVNHAAAELSDVNGTVEIHPTNGNAMVGRVDVKIPSMAAYESREFSAPLNSRMRAYEIPDWQFLRGQFVE